MLLAFCLAGPTASPALSANTKTDSSSAAGAISNDPAANPVLAKIMQSGAKLYYLGPHDGMDGWFIIKDGQIQTAYGTPDKKSLIIGAMFDYQGKNVTSLQVKSLLETNKDVAAMMMAAVQQLQSAATQDAPQTAGSAAPSPAPPSTGERLYKELLAAPGVTLGTGTPVLLMVMDPDCPHCQATWRMLRDAVMKNTIQLRMIPISAPDSPGESAGAQLLRVANPLTAWDKYVGSDKGQGDKSQLAGKPDPALVAQMRANHSLIDNWHIDQTPYLVYRSKNGTIKIVMGEPKPLETLLSDLVP